MNSEIKFITDRMLGRLAHRLRMFGYDVFYYTGDNAGELLMQSLKENRILLTRGHKLSAKRGWKLICIDHDDVDSQLKQVVSELRLTLLSSNIFTRCTLCNGEIQKITEKSQIKKLVPGFVYKNHEDFFRCISCRKVYWKGTHLDLIKKEIAKIGLKIEQ